MKSTLRTHRNFYFALLFCGAGLLAFGLTRLNWRAEAAALLSQPGQGTPESIWQDQGAVRVKQITGPNRAYRLNQNALTAVLNRAPREFRAPLKTSQTELALPLPNGVLARFRIEESPIMEPDLAARLPEVKTYHGQGVDDPTATVRFDWTPQGLHALILSAHGDFLVEPVNTGDTLNYMAHTTQTPGPDMLLQCGVTGADVADAIARGVYATGNRSLAPAFTNGATLRTYRLAVAASGEYAANYGGGNVANTQTAITSVVNLIDAIYEKELAVRFTLVNNTNIIFTNAATDPYDSVALGGGLSGNMANSATLTANQTALDNAAGLGTANYDIGHLFGGILGLPGGSASFSGFAQLGVVCVAGGKAKGVSTMGGLTATLGIFINGIAHEIGHQFSAPHTFNGTLNNCGGGNRSSGSAYESGSGSTIMSYANTCAADNIANSTDVRFHSKSFEQMLNFMTNTATCNMANWSATGNTPPTANAGADFTIPKNTPFTLTGTGTDADASDIPNLTFVWEQIDSGGAAFFQDGTNASYNDAADPVGTTTRPIFRAFPPNTSLSRTFPSLTYILNNANDPPQLNGGLETAEELPRIGRTVNFRFTARDNRANGGGVTDDSMVLTVDNNSGPFLVTAPDTAVSWTGNTQQAVTWSVNSTNLAPVSCANVKISLSTDGGNTFPTVLAASTPNDGAENITVPNLATTTARIKVEAVGNIFFDISGANFNIVLGGGNTAPTFTPAAAISRQLGSTAGAAVTVGTVNDAETPVGNLTVTQIAGGTAANMNVSGITNTNGTITAVVTAACNATAGTVRFQVSDGSLTGTGDLQVNVTANTAPTLTYANANVAANGATTVNPATGPTDNGTINFAVQSQGTYTGTISVNGTGVVSISNALPAGTHTITIRATDNCNAITDASFMLTVTAGNTAPTYTPAAPIARQQGSPPGAAVTVGTVNDVETPVGNLTVTQIAGGTAIGITVSGIVNTNGTITAQVSAACGATAGTVRFQVSDGSLTGTGNLQVNVTANAAPTLTYANASVNTNGATTVNTATGPTDNGTINTITLQSQGTYTGTISVNNTSGVVTISNAAPAGAHTITIRATDNCSAFTDATFTLTVGCISTLTVNNTGDGADVTPGNGVCETALGNGICTLRAAIQEANALAACTPFTINFSVNGIINLGTALPALNHPNLTLNGPGANLLTVRRNGAGTFRIFELNNLRTASLNGLTIADGNVVGDGGGVLNNGTLTVTGCQITGNAASSFGGGLENTGTLTINNTTIANNTVASGSTGGAIDSTGTLTLSNSTLSGNIANAADASGGIYAFGGTVTLTNCTITDNQASGFNGTGGLISTNNAAVTVKNTIIAANRDNTTVPDVNIVAPAAITSSGFNLVGNVGTVTAFNQTGDQTGNGAPALNPLVSTLANNGGPTSTNALLPGSPAINAGTAAGAPANDQRGIARVGATDIGAFESRGFTLAIGSGNNQSANINTAFANPLVVTANSANGEPVNGGRVTFTAPVAGPRAVFTGNPATIAGGQASVMATANGVAGGPYNVAADASGVTAAVNFALTNTTPTNTPPTFTPAAALARQQGSPAGAAVTVGTVTDAQTPAGSLIVTQVAGGTASGISVTNIVNTNGTITAQVSASCTAVAGTVRFLAFDGSLNGTGDLQVNVTANTAPTLTYANAAVLTGGATTINPATGPSDNGTLNAFAVQSQGTYTGTISVNASGVVSISNAAPVGAHTITIRATDNCTVTTDAMFTLTVTATCPTITVNPSDPTLPAGHAGTAYSQTFTQTGGAGAVTFSVSAGAVPTGLSLAAGGLLSGTPTVNGAFNFTVRATDQNNCTGERPYTLFLHPPCTTIMVNPATLPNSFVGAAYSQTLTATGGTAPHTFAVTTGSLPNGLTLASGGALTGMPITTGTFNFTVTATDNTGCTGTRAYTVIISGNGLQFYALPAPVRLLETRAGFSGCTMPGVPINANGTLTLPARTTCAGIPAAAAAVTGNITVVPSGPGFLTLFPSSATQPTVANSNFQTNEITNNVFTVGLGAGDGAFKIFSSATTHVIVDVTGYYAPPNTGGLFFHSLATPVRLLETRPGFTGCITPGAPLVGTGNPSADPNLDLLLQGRSPVAAPCNSIPATAQVLVGNATSVLPTGLGYLTIYPSGGTRPTVASSNYAGNDVINGPFAVKLGADGKFKIYTFATTHLVVDILGYYSEDATDANGAGLLFNPLPSPVRLLETRAGFAGCTMTGAPIVGNLASATHTQMAANFCTLPASAQAVVGNVSVVNTTGAGFLTLFPANLTTAPLVATSNYPAPATFGYNRHYFVGLSPADGKFKVLTQFTTDLILDASGYFAP